MMRFESREPEAQRLPAPLVKDLSRTAQTASAAERILVVEDDHAVQKALKRLFETEGFQIEISTDGKAALESFRRAAPSAIVLDLRLPLVSGRDVCRDSRSFSERMPCASRRVSHVTQRRIPAPSR